MSPVDWLNLYLSLPDSMANFAVMTLQSGASLATDASV